MCAASVLVPLRRELVLVTSRLDVGVTIVVNVLVAVIGKIDDLFYCSILLDKKNLY